MAGKPEAQSIGQKGPIQDPQDALRASEGTYRDAAQALPVDDKMQIRLNPAAPDKSPFTNLKDMTGGR